jgi:serine/threonine protein kinase
MTSLSNFPQEAVNAGWVPIKFIARSEEENIETYYAGPKSVLRAQESDASDVQCDYVYLVKVALPGADPHNFTREIDIYEAFHKNEAIRDCAKDKFANIRDYQRNTEEPKYIIYDKVYPAITLADFLEALGPSPMDEALTVRIMIDLERSLHEMNSCWTDTFFKIMMKRSMARPGEDHMLDATEKPFPEKLPPNRGCAHGDLQPKNVLLSIHGQRDAYPRAILSNLGKVERSAEAIHTEHKSFINLLVQCLSYNRECFESGNPHQNKSTCNHRRGTIALWDALLKQDKEKNFVEIRKWRKTVDEIGLKSLWTTTSVPRAN